VGDEKQLIKFTWPYMKQVNDQVGAKITPLFFVNNITT